MIKDIPEKERPIEKLFEKGEKALSDSELIAIILRSGTKSKSAIDLARNILEKNKDLREINARSLKSIKGVGEAKAASLAAALELGKRVYLNKTDNKVKLLNAEEIFNYTKYLFNSLKQEEFYVLYFNNKQELIETKLLFKGTINSSVVHPREIFKEAYLLSASKIVCMHNHPSGSTIPSKKDIEFTKSIVRIGSLMGVNVIDHIIVSDNKFYSFYEHNNLN